MDHLLSKEYGGSTENLKRITDNNLVLINFVISYKSLVISYIPLSIIEATYKRCRTEVL